MAYYKAIDSAPTWSSYKLGVLSKQLSPYKKGALIYATERSFGVLEINPTLYTKAKFFHKLPTPPPPPSTDGTWRKYVVLPDNASELHKYTVRSVAPAPAVNRIGELENHNNHIKVPLTQPAQVLWGNLLSYIVFSKGLKEISEPEFKYIGGRLEVMMGEFLALTNRPKGVPAANYLLGTNLDAEPAKFMPIIMAGNIIEGRPAGRNKAGQFMVQIRTIDANNLPEASINLMKDPRVLAAKIINRNGSLSNFPQLDGVPVPYPLLARQICYYPMAGLLEVIQSEN